jgi:hypothetical protein
VTLYAHDQIDEAGYRKVIDNCTVLPLELEVVELRFSGIFTRSCCIDFVQCPEFLHLRRQIQDTSGAGEDYPVNPHMSLFYGTLSDNQKQHIQEEVALPRSIRFTSIRSVYIPKRVRGPDDVKSWKFLYES